MKVRNPRSGELDQIVPLGTGRIGLMPAYMGDRQIPQAADNAAMQRLSINNGSLTAMVCNVDKLSFGASGSLRSSRKQALLHKTGSQLPIAAYIGYAVQ